MFIKPDHIIQTYIFEINFYDQEKVTALQNSVCHLFNNKLSNRMNELFDKHIPEHLLLKIDTLEIDLGSIPYFQFEEQLTELFLAELEKELLHRLVSFGNNVALRPPGKEISEFKTRFTDLLEYFLVNGSMPWWANGSSDMNLQKIADQLFSQNPETFKQLLLRVGQNINATRRFVYKFNESLLRSIIHILEPGEVLFIFDYYKHILTVQNEKLIIKTESSGFKKEVLVFILSAILIDRASNFNKKMFVKSTLHQLALHYNVNFENLLFLFASIEHQTKKTRTNYIVVLIEELISEHLRSKNTRPVSETLVASNASNTQTLFELLRYYLIFGSLPAWSRSYEKEELSHLASDLFANATTLTKELLFSIVQYESAKKRLIEITDNGLFKQMILLIESGESGFIIECAIVLTKFIEKTNGAGLENGKPGQFVKELIFTFLFSNSVFNRAVFLENSLRDIARLYNKPFGTFLSYLVQFIAEENKQGKNNTAIFYTITGILKNRQELLREDNKVINRNPKEKTKAPYPEFFPALVKNNSPRDVLSYFLVQGYLPRWGTDVILDSPEKILNGLIESSPNDALFLLKLAGTETKLRQRFLALFSLQIILKLFRTLNNGIAAIELLHAILKFIETNNHFYSKNREGIPNVLLMALWDTYERETYCSFNVDLFTQKALFYLAFKLDVPLGSITSEIKKGITKLPDAFIQFADHSNRNNLTINKHRFDDFYPNNDPLQLIEVIKLCLLPGDKQIDRDFFVATSMYILNYFLIWNKLPEHLNQIHDLQLHELLKQLIITVANENPSALKNLLKNNSFSSKAKMQLHTALALETNTAERNAKILLSEYIEPDSLQYLKEHSFAAMTYKGNLRELLESVLKNDSVNKKEILHFILNSGSLTHHVVWQFSGEKFYDLLKTSGCRISRDTIDALKELQHFLISSLADTLEREKTATLFKEFCLHYFIRSTSNTSFSEFLKTFFKFLASHKQTETLTLFILVKGKSQLSGSPVLASYISQNEIQQLLLRQINAENKNNALFLDLKRSDELILNQLVGLNLTETRKSDPMLSEGKIIDKQIAEIKEAKNKKEVDLKEKIYLQNAGLILLHPFITTFFKRLKLTENGNFVSREARHRGTYLLQCLVYESGEWSEHELVLNKLLCGIPLQQPILPGFTPTLPELEVVEELLQEVKKQWSKLKNSSINGFRSSFLQRNAILTQTGESWNMRVDQRGYDVLLETLSWSLNLIKTPWMNKFLYVEWT